MPKMFSSSLLPVRHPIRPACSGSPAGSPPPGREVRFSHFLAWRRLTAATLFALLLFPGLGAISAKDLPVVQELEPLPPDDGSVWVVLREWSLEEEERYAEWIRNHVDPDFFVRHRMTTDCADVPYALRFIYARTRYLPQGVHSPSGTVFGNWRKDFAHRPRHRDWGQDPRFRAALQFVIQGFTLGRCVPQDTYPIKIWPQDGFLRPGTVFTNSKHSGVVYTIEPSSFFPIKCAYSTLPPKIRPLIMINYEEELTYDDIGMGLVNWNWWRRDPATGNCDIVPDEEMPGYSREQYDHPVDLALRLQKAYSIIRTDKEKALDESMKSLRAELELRVEVVNEGYAAYRGTKNRATDSNLYDNYSTPGRDARLRGRFKEMEALIKNKVFDGDELIDRLRKEWIDPLSTPKMTFLEFRHAMLADNISPEPWDHPRKRWGVNDCHIEWYRETGMRIDRLAFDPEGRIVGFSGDGAAVRLSLDGAIERDPKDLFVAPGSGGQTGAPGAQTRDGLRRLYSLSSVSPDPLELADGSHLVIYANGRIVRYATLTGPGGQDGGGTDRNASAGAREEGANPDDATADAEGAREADPEETDRGAAGSARRREATRRPTGRMIVWEREIDSHLYASAVAGPATDGPEGGVLPRAVYVPTETGFLYALDPRDGAVRWRAPLGSRAIYPAVVAPSGNIFLAGADTILALTPNGKIRWSQTLPDVVYCSPAVGPDESVYIGCLDEHVYALRPDGKRRWSFPARSSVLTTPLVSPDGQRVFAASTGGLLFCLSHR